jgi:hypothetical protein
VSILSNNGIIQGFPVSRRVLLNLNMIDKRNTIGLNEMALACEQVKFCLEKQMQLSQSEFSLAAMRRRMDHILLKAEQPLWLCAGVEKVAFHCWAEFSKQMVELKASWENDLKELSRVARLRVITGPEQGKREVVIKEEAVGTGDSVMRHEFEFDDYGFPKIEDGQLVYDLTTTKSLRPAFVVKASRRVVPKVVFLNQEVDEIYMEFWMPVRLIRFMVKELRMVKSKMESLLKRKFNLVTKPELEKELESLRFCFQNGFRRFFERYECVLTVVDPEFGRMLAELEESSKKVDQQELQTLMEEEFRDARQTIRRQLLSFVQLMNSVAAWPDLRKRLEDAGFSKSKFDSVSLLAGYDSVCGVLKFLL